jgi:3-phosphoshikimate 1-carboxyvinyltransferase
LNRTLTIQPRILRGEALAPPSKSIAHRAVIAAALAQGGSIVGGVELSQDIEATVCAVSALGAKVSLQELPGGRRNAFVEGIVSGADEPVIDCRESGSTLRFLLPVALAVSGGAAFTGSRKLAERPLGPYIELFRQRGIRAKYTDTSFPLEVSGMLAPGEFKVPGGVSSQFVTGLMLALPLLDGDSTIIVEGGLESLGYVDITVDVLHAFGVAVEEEQRGERYAVIGNQRYISRKFDVEGDWSQSAFLLLMGLLGGPVKVSGLSRRSPQGDRTIEEIFRNMGGDLRWEGDALVALRSKLHAATVDVSQCPDLAPAVAAAMAVAEGESRIAGGKRLRMKESDRIASIAACLNVLGAKVTPLEDGLQIVGVRGLKGGEAPSANDHRIAMMAAAASPLCTAPIMLSGWEAVNKSWPGFWEDFGKLGGETDGQPMGQEHTD